LDRAHKGRDRNVGAPARSVQGGSASKNGLRKAPDDAGQAVFLVGFMGAGKTSVGRALARRLNWTFEDLDDRIEHREGRRIAEIFRSSGEREFRRAERAALEESLKELHNSGNRVIALGGGAFVQRANALRLQASGVPTIFLDAPIDELWRRCSKQASDPGAERPLRRSLEEFRKLHEIRRPGYLTAEWRIQTGGRSVRRVAEEIARKLVLEPKPKSSREGDAK
jgi:shikimate kinase